MASVVHPSRELQQLTRVPDERRHSVADAAPEPMQTCLQLLALFVLYAIPLFATLRPDTDHDIWWHLRTGQWLVEHRAVPVNDPFSDYGQDKAWIAYSWLFEVLIYGLYQFFGLCGFVVYRAAMSLAVTAALHRFIAQRERRFLQQVVLTLLAVFAVAVLCRERPWLFTILFTILTLSAILNLRADRRGPLVWLLPLVFALWANLHIQFIYGLLLLCLACLAPVVDRLSRREAESAGAARLGSGSWRFLVALTAACSLATLATPFHVRLYGVVVEYAMNPGPYRFINELKALEFRDATDWILLALVGGAAYSLGRRVPGSSFELLLLAGTTFLAFRMRRDLWIGVLGAVTILTQRTRLAALPEQRFEWTAGRASLIAGGLALLAVLLVCWRPVSNESIERAAAKQFPVAAAKFVEDKQYAGPLYNDLNWGGYLIWALPQYRVAIDGRTNLHGDERLLRFGRIWAGSPRGRDDPDLAAAGIVIAGAEMPLSGLLSLDPRFERVYQDEVANVFVRKSANLK